ncbi:orotate phosphoribosyltransferase [Elusimicrobium posterum]|uniref:phosphoribosyltransferase family protein n=1 Tax=Elusimicrobium posterum TaxID=3116653 RepID=UPI003C75ADAF
MPRNKTLNMLAILQEHELFEYGHFRLSCGMHSHLYIKAGRIMKFPNMAQKTARAMARLFTKRIDAVVSPSEETFLVAQEVGNACNVRAGYTFEHVNGTLILKKNFIIKPAEQVLIVDDVSVSGKKIERAINLIKKMGAKVIGVAVIVDRSSGYMPFNVPLRALLSYPLRTYHSADCPLCKSSIPLITNYKEEEND